MSASEELFVSRRFAAGFTAGIEGPACDDAGNLYAVNYARQGTIGIVTPEGMGSVFVELRNGSVGNGIRFHPDGTMLIADYTNHNILAVAMASRLINVYAHEPTLNQPNDLAVDDVGTVYASDPRWSDGTGQIWCVGTDRRFGLLETNMGTTNGIEVSADNRTLYVNETVQRSVWAYDRTSDGGVRNKRLLIQFPDGGLDGMRCDAAGNLYVTRHGKGTVAKLSPQGDVLREVALAGKLCTNVAFGGPDGRTCYVTLADDGTVEQFRVDLPGRETPAGHRYR